jgi:hypothetical protein
MFTTRAKEFLWVASITRYGAIGIKLGTVWNPSFGITRFTITRRARLGG